MVCFWIGKDSSTNGICRLIPDETTRESGIEGIKTFNSSNVNEQYWDCGNQSYFNIFITFDFIVK